MKERTFTVFSTEYFSVKTIFSLLFFFYSEWVIHDDRIEWRLRDPQKRTKRNERRIDAPFPSAVAVSRNIPCGHDDTDKDILVYEVRNASNHRDVRKLAGNWYLSFFLFPMTSKPYVDLRRAVQCWHRWTCYQSAKKKEISFTPLWGVAETDKIAVCVHTWRKVKANLHGSLLMILDLMTHLRQHIRRKKFLFRKDVAAFVGIEE